MKAGRTLKVSLGAAAMAVASVFAPMAHGQAILRDAEIEKILRSYADPLFEAAHINPSDVEIYLVNDDSLNAGVMAGQVMILHTGLVIKAKNPEEVKGVIAHEIGHIAAGHNITRGAAMGNAQGVQLMSMGLGLLVAALGNAQAGIAIAGSSSTFGILTLFNYTRDEESQSDQLAINYLQATGQTGEGLVSFMENFRYQELMQSGQQSPFFRSHPMSNDRINSLRDRANKISVNAKPQSQIDIDNMARMKAKLIGYLKPPQVTYRLYPKTDTSIPARYARAFAAYRAIDIKAALTEVDSLLAEEPNNPFLYELKGQILFENKRIEDSVTPHRKAVELAPDQPMLKVNLARSLIATKKPENVQEAEFVLKDALVQDKEDAFAWNQLAVALGEQNRIPEADLATAERYYNQGGMQGANYFARRALGKLPRGTPNWQRASDIDAITDPRLAGGPNAQRRARGG